MTTRVLIADDEPAYVQLISRFLNQEGYETATARNGEEALNQIRTGRPDVILLDVCMPQRDGLAVCRQLRSDFRTRGIPIILLTGKGTVEDRMSGYTAGADDYLTKPFDMEELRVRIEGALHRRQWDQGSNPLTHLPGSPAIEEEVRKRLNLGTDFAFTYIDIDHFKAYNDVYGYPAGDHVIKDLGKSLLNVMSQFHILNAFPGHIGGDDFIVIAEVEDMKKILPELVFRFDSRRLGYYRPTDQESGKIVAADRQGKVQDFPLMTLSLAVVSTLARDITHFARLVEIAGELKSYIKQQPHHGKSLVLWDRRVDDRAGKLTRPIEKSKESQ